MKKAKKLNFTSKEKKQTKRFRSFVISFAAFVIILGSVSLLMFMKSIDFNINNLVSSSEKTTHSLSETETSSVLMQGESEILFICNNSNSEITFAFLLSTNFAENTVTVRAIPIDTSVNYNGSVDSLSAVYKKMGAVAFVKAFEDYSNIDVDKYIDAGELQFKNFASKFKDTVVNVPYEINPKDSGGLSLNSGEQSLTADMLLKYMKYTDLIGKSDAFSSLLSEMLANSHIGAIDNLFEYIVNNSNTDISIVNYTNEKDKISQMMNIGCSVESEGVFAVSENKR